jgi:site-specific recombinase XerD
VAHLVARHAATATVVCPSMGTKNVTPHTLRHSTAMAMLRSGVDVSVISLWLGHESTASTTMYLHADMSLKEHALALTAPTSGDGAMKRYSSLSARRATDISAITHS